MSAGATCDHHYKNRTSGLIGVDIMRPDNSLGRALRSMCDPTSIGRCSKDLGFSLALKTKYKDSFKYYSVSKN